MDRKHTALLHCKTIGKGGDKKLLDAAKHNLREIEALSADPELSASNVIMRGPNTAKAVTQLAVSMRERVGWKRIRKDATIAGEIVFSLPPTTEVNLPAYFAACLQWVDSFFGADIVFSAVVHLDEGAPHMHVLMLAMRAGQWVGSDVFGRRYGAPEQRIKATQDDFFAKVAHPFGLRRAPDKLLAKDRQRIAARVIEHLKAAQDASMKSAVWMVLRAQIEANPAPFAEALGIKVERTMRTSTQVFTSAGKGPKREKSYIGIHADERKLLTCVGVHHFDHSSDGAANVAVPASEPAASTPVSTESAAQMGAEEVRRQRARGDGHRGDAHAGRACTGFVDKLVDAESEARQVRMSSGQPKNARATSAAHVDTSQVSAQVSPRTAISESIVLAQHVAMARPARAPLRPSCGASQRYRGTLHLSTMRELRSGGAAV